MPRIVLLGVSERVTRKELQTAAAIKKRNRTYRTNGAYRTDKKMGGSGMRREERSLTAFRDDYGELCRKTFSLSLQNSVTISSRGQPIRLNSPVKNAILQKRKKWLAKAHAFGRNT